MELSAKFETEIGHWMDRLDDRYCMLVEEYSIQDLKDTARHFAEWGEMMSRKTLLEVSVQKNTEINVLKDLLKVVTGKETFDDAVAVALNAVREAKASVAQEQVPYDCYEKLECFTEKLYVNQSENQYGDSQISV